MKNGQNFKRFYLFYIAGCSSSSLTGLISPCRP
nr:MAG TPA: glycoside hydrolase family protein [Caudoviricetes sp.]